MSIFFKYPKVKNFRNVVEHLIYSEGTVDVRLKFLRTVKIHGTNAAVVINIKTDEVYSQSRNRVLTVNKDNAGFANWVESNKDVFIDIKNKYFSDEYNYALISDEEPELFIIYGEWFGPGVQKNVGVNNLESKYFAPFSYSVYYFTNDVGHVTTNYVIEQEEENLFYKDGLVYPITMFGTEIVEIDFNDFENVQKDLLEQVEEIGLDCPVAKFFGTEGPGEGYVYHCLSDSACTFKVKSEAHRTSNTVAGISYANFKDVEKLVDDICTDARLEQGISQITEIGLPLEISSMGDYIKWVIVDTNTEESTAIAQSELNLKVINSVIAKRAREFYRKYLLDNLAIELVNKLI